MMIGSDAVEFLWINLTRTTTQNLTIDNSTKSDFCTTERKSINEDTSTTYIIENSSTERYDTRTEFSGSRDLDTIIYYFGIQSSRKRRFVYMSTENFYLRIFSFL